MSATELPKGMITHMDRLLQLAPDGNSVLWLVVRTGPALYEARMTAYDPEHKPAEGGQITLSIRSVLPKPLPSYRKHNLTPEVVGMGHRLIPAARPAAMQLYALRGRAEEEYNRVRQAKGR